jgi:hypothetical protein
LYSQPVKTAIADMCDGVKVDQVKRVQGSLPDLLIATACSLLLMSFSF